MRKDVILGMTIGGVMLALIVIYLTVSTGGKSNKHGVEYAGGSGDVGTTDVSGANSGEDPAGGSRAPLDFHASQQRPIDALNDRGNYKPTLLIAGDEERRDEKWGEKLFGKVPGVNVTTTPDAHGHQLRASGNVADQPQGSGGEQNRQPPSQQQRQRPAAELDDLKGPHSGAKPAAPPATSTAVPPAVLPNDKASGAGGVARAGVPTPQQFIDPGLENKTHLHKVQKGETYSTIAAAAYGSANYYPHLIRANPHVDPTRLKPGMEINIPDVADVKPSSAAQADAGGGGTASPKLADASPAVHRAEPVIDSKTEYRVQSGDSLHKIAIKLYGKIEFVDRIYELNQTAIGPDKAKLKLGMVLKLPEPPSANR